MEIKQTTEKYISEVNFRELWQGLTHNQQRFAVAMLDAPSKKEAAKAIGVEPSTVYRWNEAIDGVVTFMQAQARDAAIEILANSTVKASMVKVAALDSGNEKARQDAATEILDRTLGRAAQPLVGAGGGPIQIEDVNETRDRLLAELSEPMEEAPEEMASAVAE